MHDRDHYALMVIDIPGKKVVIFDWLYKDLNKWDEAMHASGFEWRYLSHVQWTTPI
jgi:hypothetical protein